MWQTATQEAGREREKNLQLGSGSDKENAIAHLNHWLVEARGIKG